MALCARRSGPSYKSGSSSSEGEGQHSANKQATCVWYLWVWQVAELARSMPTGSTCLLPSLQEKNRFTKEGVLVISSQRHRTQA